MRRWWEGRMVGFDVETTAADPREARIVTACVAQAGGGEPTDVRTWLADPGMEIPEEAAGIHGVTTERARAEGRPAGEVVAEIIDLLAEAVEGRPLVIFNARYDLTVLHAEAVRHGLVPLLERVPGLCVIDPFVIDKWLDQFRPGKRQLRHVSAHYGAPLAEDDAHDAAADTLAALRVAWVIGAKGAVVRKRYSEALTAVWEDVRYDLRRLHAAQEAWAAEQAVSLREYFASRGQEERVEAEWPVLPDRPSLVTS